MTQEMLLGAAISIDVSILGETVLMSVFVGLIIGDGSIDNGDFL